MATTPKHVGDIGLARSTDDSIWAYAAQTGAVLISKDEDFALMQIWIAEGPAVVWVRVGNLRRRELKRFESALSQLIAAIERGEKLIELTD